jgi:hypothetical protein
MSDVLRNLVLMSYKIMAEKCSQVLLHSLSCSSVQCLSQLLSGTCLMAVNVTVKRFVQICKVCWLAELHC